MASDDRGGGSGIDGNNEGKAATALSRATTPTRVLVASDDKGGDDVDSEGDDNNKGRMRAIRRLEAGIR